MIEIPNKLKIEGINFVLIESKGKKPFERDWQKKEMFFDNPKLLNHLKNNGNYGVRGGGNRHLIIVDFDNEGVQEKAIKQLPETFTIKTGSGLLHKYFFSDEAISFKIFSEEMDTFADIQGEGKQVVGAGSTHPNGNHYELVVNKDIAFINYSELKAIMLSYDKKPKKEIKQEIKKEKIEGDSDFIDELKSSLSIPNLLSHLGVDTSKNPTECPMHGSKGGKCLGFENDYCHCFHCDGSWNIFSLMREYKNCDFKTALEELASIAGLTSKLEESRKKYINKLKEQERTIETDLKKEVVMLTSGKEKNWGKASEILVEYILDKNYIYTTKDDLKSEMWFYKYGIYTPNGKSEVKEILRRVMGSFYNAYLYNLVIAKIEPDTYIEADKFFNINYIKEIPVENGILNLETRELSSFNPKKIFFNKLPVKYDKDIKAEKIDKFLKDILSKEEDRKVFYEIGGFCLLKEYKFEKAFMFVGNGRNGKDKSLELIKRLLGIENVCSVALGSLIPDSFIISEFHNKMANLAGEINNQDLKDTSGFKALTGRSLLSAQRKFLTPISFVNYAKFIFACNELPMVYDNSKGFWDRWVVLEFPHTFVTQSELDSSKDKSMLKLRDESIIEKITTKEEMSGLLNLFLDGLDRILRKRNFSSTTGSDEVKQFWIRKSNSVMAFCLSEVEEDYEAFVSKKQFRLNYSRYCRLHKVSPKSDVVIKRTLQDMFGVSEERKDIFGGSYTPVWEGIKLKL
jgi:P4 family phage/plasmid primase-like protien